MGSRKLARRRGKKLYLSSFNVKVILYKQVGEPGSHLFEILSWANFIRTMPTQMARGAIWVNNLWCYVFMNFLKAVVPMKWKWVVVLHQNRLMVSLEEDNLLPIFLCCTGVELIHAMHQAPRLVGRSCVGIGLMTSTLVLLLVFLSLSVIEWGMNDLCLHLHQVGFWSWVLCWSPEGLQKQIKLLSWSMLSEWWLNWGVKHRSWRTQTQASMTRSKSWRWVSCCFH